MERAERWIQKRERGRNRPDLENEIVLEDLVEENNEETLRRGEGMGEG